MSFIPFYEEPREGEILNSWVRRLAVANRLPLRYFAHSFLGISGVNKDTFPPDVRGVFKPLYEHIYKPGDMAELFLATSTFRFEAMAMTPETQMRYLNNITYPKDALNHSVQGLFDKLCYCPECAKEDEEAYGSYHMHAEHHLSGIKCCPKHKVPLLYTASRVKHSLDDMAPYEGVTDSDIAYAEYADALYRAKIDTDILDVKSVITERYKELGYTVSNGYGPLIRDIRQWRHGAMWGARGSDRFLKTKLNKARNVTMTELIPLLMFLYPDPKDFIAALPEHEPLVETYTCFTCGKTYVASPLAMRQGWGCPECAKDIPVGERFGKLVDTAGDGEYELLSDFTSMTERVKMVHTPCKKEFSVTPEYFLFRGGRCPCGGYDPWKKIEEHPGFKLISYNGAHSTCTIYHQTCDQEFECTYYKFLEAPRCRACDPTRFTQETFEKAVRDLVGDEYTVVGEYKGRLENIAIRHSCGNVHEYVAGRFLKGSRCPHCSERHGFVDVEEALDTYSKGRYVLNKAVKDWEVFDTYTGDSVVLNLPWLLQEITRPTPSPVLPLDGTEGEDWVPYWYVMYDLLTTYLLDVGSFEIHSTLWYDGRPLGPWYARQVALLNRGSLSEEKASLLADVGVVPAEHSVFYGVPADERWNLSASLLRRYVKENGCGTIPTSTVFEGLHLGAWVYAQRKNHENGVLSEERAKTLLSINPDIFAEKTKRLSLDGPASLEQYILYIKETGKYHVPYHTYFHGYALGYWYDKQRKLYQNGELSDEDVAALLKVNPDMFVLNQYEFKSYFDKYLRYVDKTGLSVIPYKEVFEGWHIGRWFQNQLSSYKAGTMSKDRAECFFAVNRDVFNPRSTSYLVRDEDIKRYERYIKETGNAIIHKDTVFENVNLSSWLKKVCRMYRKGELSEEQIGKLSAINPYFFSFKDTIWENNFQEYKTCVRKNGNVCTSNRLYAWLYRQRMKYQEGKLSEEQIEKLRSIDPDSFTPECGMRHEIHHNDDVWEQWRQLYVRCVKETGKTYIPYPFVFENKNLGIWYRYQLTRYKQGKLPKEREEKLLEINPDMFKDR